MWVDRGQEHADDGDSARVRFLNISISDHRSMSIDLWRAKLESCVDYEFHKYHEQHGTVFTF